MKILSLTFLLFIVVFLNCQGFQQPTFKLIIFHDPDKTHQILINGRPLSEFGREGKGMYAEDYRIYREKIIVLQIKAGENIIVEQTVESGSYLINLSNNYAISYEEVSYGRQCSPCKLGNMRVVGIEKLSDRSDILPFDFNEKPPEEIRTKSSNTLRDRQFFILKAWKKAFK